MPLFQFPKYTHKQKEALAWLFTSLMKIDLNPPKLTIIHTNRDFIHRFKQLIRLGRYRNTSDLNTVAWECSDPKELLFFLQEIQDCIHTQRECTIVRLLIKHLQKAQLKTERKLEKLIKIHNIYFHYFQILC